MKKEKYNWKAWHFSNYKPMYKHIAVATVSTRLVTHAKVRLRHAADRIYGRDEECGIAWLGRMETAVCWHWVTGQNGNSCMLTLSDWAEWKQLYAATEWGTPKWCACQNKFSQFSGGWSQRCKTSSGINVKSKGTPHRIKCHTCHVTLSF